MSKKSILALAILVAVVSSSVTFAAKYQLPWTKNIYEVSDSDKNYQPSVSVFDDGDNKCYVVYTSSSSNAAISCVKR